MAGKIFMKYKILKTSEFESWLDKQPPKVTVMIKSRLDLISIGHFGFHKRFEGLIELKWISGLRVYTFIWKNSLVVALYGGNKNGQSRDIKKAKKIKAEVIEGTRTIYE